MKFGAFSPGLKDSALHAMSSDDVPLYFDMENLTEKQRVDHIEMCYLIGMLQVCLFAISKPEDYVAVYDVVKSPPFDEIMRRYHAIMQKVGFNVVPLDHMITAPVETFYEDVARQLPPVDAVNFLMVSRSNEVIHGDTDAIERMLLLNSKAHFAENAPRHGIPVPESLCVTSPLAGNEAAEAMFARHDGRIMLKMPGTPGGRNVIPVTSAAEADAVIQRIFSEDREVVLQQKLDLSEYEEWTVDLLITDDAIVIDNTRHILMADGKWVGNHMPPENPLTPEQEAVLLNVGAYARSFGHSGPEGYNMGIDFFIGPDGEILVTEINPRWTAGLFPSEILRRLGPDDRHTVAYFETMDIDIYPDYFDFIEQRLPGTGNRDYDVTPIGFSPFDIEIEGKKILYVWLVVRGDFAAYRNDVRGHFKPGDFPAADQIPVDMIHA